MVTVLEVAFQVPPSSLRTDTFCRDQENRLDREMVMLRASVPRGVVGRPSMRGVKLCALPGCSHEIVAVPSGLVVHCTRVGGVAVAAVKAVWCAVEAVNAA